MSTICRPSTKQLRVRWCPKSCQPQGSRRRRRPEQTERVAPFAEHRRAADEIAEKSVQPHHGARRLIALGAQARAQHVHDRVAHGIRRFIEAQPVVFDIELGVLPAAPQCRTRRESSSPHAAQATRIRAEQLPPRSSPTSAHRSVAAKTAPGTTWPSVVMPVNGAFASSAQPPNSSWARGLCSRASACARGRGSRNPRLPGGRNERPIVGPAHERGESERAAGFVITVHRSSADHTSCPAHRKSRGGANSAITRPRDMIHRVRVRVPPQKAWTSLVPTRRR